MAASYYLLPTHYGRTKIAALLAGEKVPLVSVAIGDANGQPYLPESRLGEVNLVHERVRVPVQSVAAVGDITKVITTIDSTIGGFNFHELAILDETGKAVYLGNYHGQYKPVLTEGAGGEIELHLELGTAAIGSVFLQVDPTVVTANKAWVNENFVVISHLNDVDPHPQYLTKVTAAANGIVADIPDNALFDIDYNTIFTSGTYQSNLGLNAPFDHCILRVYRARGGYTHQFAQTSTGIATRVYDASTGIWTPWRYFVGTDSAASAYSFVENTNSALGYMGARLADEANTRYSQDVDYFNNLQNKINVEAYIRERAIDAEHQQRVDEDGWLQQQINGLNISGNFAPHGWVSLPGGLVLQWGSLTTTNQRTRQDPQFVGLHKPMNRLFFASLTADGGATDAIEYVDVDFTVSTGTTLAVYSNYVGECRYFAIGR